MSTLQKPAVLLSQRDGSVVMQNEQALRLCGRGLGQPCWSVVGAVKESAGLPCNDGCVGRLLDHETGHAMHTPFLHEDRPYHLSCVSLGTLAACVITVGASHEAQSWQYLTPREKQILQLVADGVTTGAIAGQLGLSERTIRAHLEHIRTKLGASTRAAAVAQAFRLGLLH